MGAFSIRTGESAADTNSKHGVISNTLRAHAEKFNIKVGDQGACGTRYVVGRCAEWRSANKLIIKGAKVKFIRWIDARHIDPGAWGSGKLGSIRQPCGICNSVGFNKR